VKIFVESRLSELTPEEERSLMERRPSVATDLEGDVRTIIQRVRAGGDGALVDLARELDGVELDSLEVPLSRCRAAAAALPEDVRRALEHARRNIEAFHRAQLDAWTPLKVEVEPGIELERRAIPLKSVGVYAPGGRAAYPTSVLMGVVPAVVAGVAEIVVCSPPGAEGGPSPEVLAAAAIGGATRVFSLGGAGAVAALAYGTETVPQVGAVVGPGNAWVTEAKRQLAGMMRIDSPAGPSELLVVADEVGEPRLIALEMLAQAEHDPDAVVGLVSPSPGLVRDTRGALEELLSTCVGHDVASEALARNGFLILTESREEAMAFTERFAPEHLLLMTTDADTAARAVRTSGAVFVGHSTSVAFGDYMTGANHVLPTAGLAGTYSGLSVEHYLRTFTIQRVSRAAAAALADDVAALAEAEGLPGHAAAARARKSS